MSAAVLTVARIAEATVHTSAHMANMCEKERKAQNRLMKMSPAAIGCNTSTIASPFKSISTRSGLSVKSSIASLTSYPSLGEVHSPSFEKRVGLLSALQDIKKN